MSTMQGAVLVPPTYIELYQCRPNTTIARVRAEPAPKEYHLGLQCLELLVE